MGYDLSADQSHWWSLLVEFAEDVLIPARKKLRITQHEISSRLGLSQSEISRIERGVVKPHNIIITTAICDIYQLTLAQREKYTQILAGVNQNIDSTSSVILSDLLANQIEHIGKINRGGFPQVAIQNAQNLREWVTNYSQDTTLFSQNIKEKLLHLLLEESAAWWDIVLPDNLDVKTNTLISTMQKLVKTTTDFDEGNIYLKINKGFHNYIKGDFAEAYRHFASIEKNKIKDKLWHIEVLRASSITAGKLKKFYLLKRYEDTIEQHTKSRSTSFLNKGYLLEGLARGYAEFNPEKSLKIFDHASRFISLARKEPSFLKIRYIQFVRSYVATLKKINSNRKTVEDIIRPALKEASGVGFIRHHAQLVRALQE